MSHRSDRKGWPRSRRPLAVALAAVLGCHLLGAAPTAARTQQPKLAAPAPNLAPARPEEPVPQNHWAYDAMTQLSQRGRVTSFAAHTFSGKRALSRADFARGIADMLVLSTLTRQAGGFTFKNDALALRRLVEVFGPELNAEGIAVDKLQQVESNLLAMERGAGPLGLVLPIPPPPYARDLDLAWSSKSDTFRVGVSRAAAEWSQGLVLLNTLGPVPDTGDAFPLAIPMVSVAHRPGAPEEVVGHNSEVWRRLREEGPPSGTSLSWLGELFDLKRLRTQFRRDQRFVSRPNFGGSTEHVLSTAGVRLRQVSSWNCFGPFPKSLHAHSAAGEVELPGPPGSDWGWSSIGDPEVLWGRPGSGVVYLRVRTQERRRIYVYDLRTGWLLNAGEG